MATRWFRATRIGTGTLDDPYRPEYSSQVEAWTGHRIGNSPEFVVRFRATTSTLDSIASNNGISELTDDQALNLLNGASVAGLEGSGRPWTVEDLNNEKFVV